jgi:hypothetical protein
MPTTFQIQNDVLELTKILDKEKNGDLTFSYDSATRRLTIRGAVQFPPIYDFYNHIEILDMSGGHMSKLPNDFSKMKNLKVLFLSNNDFEEIPEVIVKISNLDFLGMKSCKISLISEMVLPKNLRWLTLTDNQIDHLPKSIGDLKKLEKLLLAGNRLSVLPKEIVQCQNLSLIKISANNFQDSPLDILSNLPKLAWYGDAGNPFCNNENIEMPSVNFISQNAIEIKEMIGESAQNKVYKARLKETKMDVAIKVYGGKINSDGYTEDEIKASIFAGEHPHLVGAIGIGQDALVLPLISPDFHNLGLPPSLSTCTRDTFSEDTTFSNDYIANVLSGICQVSIFLHSKGIMHGDLYAHNILVNKNGYPYLGDFGSASLYNPSKDFNREKIDVRAFGYLIDDLLTHCVETETKDYKKFDRIRQSCLKTNPIDQPTFLEINKILEN